MGNADPSATSLQIDDDLYQSIYAELRQIAGKLLHHRQPLCTLTPTEIVHEAYVKLRPAEDDRWSGRTHFVAHAALAMRHVLVDHARHKLAAKNGGNLQRVTFTGTNIGEPSRELEVLELNEALDDMAELSPRTARIVDLRVFGGLTASETAELMGISESTAKKDWRFARLWLSERLQP